MPELGTCMPKLSVKVPKSFEAKRSRTLNDLDVNPLLASYDCGHTRAYTSARKTRVVCAHGRTWSVVKFISVGGPNDPKFVIPAATPPSDSSFMKTSVFVLYKV